MKVGSLFSGIGGLDLGLERAGWEVKWQVEVDPWCRRVLAKHWPDVARSQDIRNCHGASVCVSESCAASHLPYVDLIAGGFPCQPFSHSGHREGAGDNRYLWPEMLRVIRELHPAFVLAENVYGLVTGQQGLLLETVYFDLEAAGYEVAPPIVFPAAALGALHRRDRVWICAHARHHNGRSEPQQQQAERPQGIGSVGSPGGWGDVWTVEPDVGRVASRIPSRVDRLRGLGNAVVPQVAEMIGRQIMANSGEKE